MGMVAEQVAQLGEADTRGTRQGRSVGESLRRGGDSPTRPSNSATFSSSPR